MSLAPRAMFGAAGGRRSRWRAPPLAAAAAVGVERFTNGSRTAYRAVVVRGRGVAGETTCPTATQTAPGPSTCCAPAAAGRSPASGWIPTRRGGRGPSCAPSALALGTAERGPDAMGVMRAGTRLRPCASSPAGTGRARSRARRAWPIPAWRPACGPPYGGRYRAPRAAVLPLRPAMHRSAFPLPIPVPSARRRGEGGEGRRRPPARPPARPRCGAQAAMPRPLPLGHPRPQPRPRPAPERILLPGPAGAP